MRLRELRARYTWGHTLIYRLAIFSLSQQIAIFLPSSLFSLSTNTKTNENIIGIPRVCACAAVWIQTTQPVRPLACHSEVYPGPGQVTAKGWGNERRHVRKWFSRNFIFYQLRDLSRDILIVVPRKQLNQDVGVDFCASWCHSPCFLRSRGMRDM